MGSLSNQAPLILCHHFKLISSAFHMNKLCRGLNLHSDRRCGYMADRNHCSYRGIFFAYLFRNACSSRIFHQSDHHGGGKTSILRYRRPKLYFLHSQPFLRYIFFASICLSPICLNTLLLFVAFRPFGRIIHRAAKVKRNILAGHRMLFEPKGINGFIAQRVRFAKAYEIILWMVSSFSQFAEDRVSPGKEPVRYCCARGSSICLRIALFRGGASAGSILFVLINE